MITALRTTPQEFELESGWLRHVRSRHYFRFAPDDRVEIHAACNCALLAVRADQERELAGCYREWCADYWRPLQANREFAAHFARRPRIWRVLTDLTGRLHRWLVRQARERDTVGDPSPTS